MILWLMLIFYVFIMFIYFIPTESKISFDKIHFHLNHPNQACASDSDCNNNEKCFQSKCYPTYRSTHFCNPITGSWVLEDIKGVPHLKCTCKYPNIITQKFEGANCDVDIACAPNGQLKTMFLQNITQAKCVCKRGYRSTPYPQIGCKKLLPSEIEKSACDADEIHISQASSVYHMDYIKSLPAAKKCIKNPCSFNVLNNEPLKHTKFDPKYGCVCNPAYGNFGVKFEKFANYLVTRGYDACGNIFKKEPNIETRVKLFTYYYINDGDPISFIQFSGLRPDFLVDELKNFVKNNNLQIDEMWPYNYSQYIFENEYFLMHTRKCYLDFRILQCNERVMRERQMTNCDNIIHHLPIVNTNRHIEAYDLLYQFPMCRYTSSDFNNRYNGWYVLNPHLLSFKEYRRLYRSNGIELFYVLDDRWIANLASSEYDKYEPTSVYPQLPSLPPPSALPAAFDTSKKLLI